MIYCKCLRKLFPFLAMLLLLGNKLYGQPASLDSLKLEWVMAQSDSQYVEAAIALGIALEKNKQFDSAIIVFEAVKGRFSEQTQNLNYAHLLVELGRAYHTVNKRQLAIQNLGEALKIAEKLENPDQQFSTLNNLGNVYSYMGIYDTAEVYLIRALELQQLLGDKRKEAGILQNLGNNMARGNKLNQSLAYYEQSLTLMREIKNSHGEGLIRRLMGYTCSRFGDYPRALEYYQQALKKFEQLESPKETAYTFESLGELYSSMENYPVALEYYEKAANIWEEEGKKKEQIKSSFRRGKVFLLKQEYETAKRYFQTFLKVKKAAKQKILGTEVFFLLGTCNENLQELDSALVWYNLFLEKGTLSNDPLAKTRGLTAIGKVHLQQGDLPSAISTLRSALEVADVPGLRQEKTKVVELLYQVYKKGGSFEEALSCLELLRRLEDTLFNENKVRQFAQMEANYEFDKEKQQLVFQQNKKLQEQRFITWVILISLGIVTLFMLAIAHFYRLKQKANKELSKLNEEILKQKVQVENQKVRLEELDLAKTRFFTNISHEFRTPLTVISGMAEQIFKHPRLWAVKGARMIKRNSASLLLLVNQILDLSKLESHALKAQFVKGDIIRYCRYLTESFQSYAESKGVSINYQTARESLIADYDPDKLMKIISNLLSNAVKHTPEGGEVCFKVDLETSSDNPILKIEVTDSGSGIPGDELPFIFDRFYQVDDSSTRNTEGTGIGLALTKELVKLLNGQINVESKIGTGSTFIISLPITHSSTISSDGMPASLLPTQDILLVDTPASIKQESGKATQSLPHLLIVEDNIDVTEFLVACLEGKYQLTIARNGREGIEAALGQVPDLILSDVMMPEKNGYELCEALKTDPRTSHIPIVLLTAKVDTDSRIQGLKKGADAYLAKPFKQEELFVRLEKLLELRRLLQNRYKNASAQAPQKEKTFEQEDQFIATVRQAIELNLQKTDFNITQLCEMVGMSRSHLHRKMTALTGQSPNAFIRQLRLQKAKTLLGSSPMNVSEIAYEVGFNDPKYFSRAFTKEFGIAPSTIKEE